MLIVSQDRMTVVNLDCVERFGVTVLPSTAESSLPWVILADMSHSVNGAVLGRYETKKRAMSVLREIVAPPCGFVPQTSYQMPEV